VNELFRVVGANNGDDARGEKSSDDLVFIHKFLATKEHRENKEVGKYQ